MSLRKQSLEVRNKVKEKLKEITGVAFSEYYNDLYGKKGGYEVRRIKGCFHDWSTSFEENIDRDWYHKNDSLKWKEEIDQLDFLTPHEKKYALIDYFKLDLILISETLSVSTRTVETNYYRIRKKLKENNCQEKYPFHRIK